MDNVITDALFALLRPQRLTAIVDIGANPVDGEPPYQAMNAAGLCTVTGFEPQPDALAELQRRKGPREIYLPHAVGDGRHQTLHVCHCSGMTSLLAPDPAQLERFNELPKLARVEREMSVATRRLDDIEEIQHVDFLKIDIQGAELQVFESGQRKLTEAVVIQTELSFVPIYREQPAFGVIDTALRRMGFIPHCIADLLLWPIAPTMIDGNPMKPVHQLLEGDLVYVRNFFLRENMTGEQWKHLAMIAHHCYRSVDLAAHAVAMATEIGALPSGSIDRYYDILSRH
jgi:FkbM family methyltransferase